MTTAYLVFNLCLLLLLGLALFRRPDRSWLPVFALYMVGALLSFVFNPYEDFPTFDDPSLYPWYAIPLYGVLVCYALTPLLAFQKTSLQRNYRYLLHQPIMRKLLWVMALGGFFAFVYQAPFAVTALRSGASVVRLDLQLNDEFSALPPNFFTTIAVFFSTFFALITVLFFLSLLFSASRLQVGLLFLASLSYVVSSFAFTARDGIVLYLLIASSMYLISYRQLPVRTRRWFLVGALLLLSGLLFVLFIITGDRFGSVGAGFLDGVVNYGGTQPYVLGQNILERHVRGFPFYGTSLRFPILGAAEVPLKRSFPFEWVFGGMYMDFYNVAGFASLFFITVMFTEMFRALLLWTRKSVLPHLITKVFFIHFIGSGFFYFRLGNFAGNVYLLLMVLLIILLKRVIDLGKI